jgi:hypothetical protein
MNTNCDKFCNYGFRVDDFLSGKVDFRQMTKDKNFVTISIWIRERVQLKIE